MHDSIFVCWHLPDFDKHRRCEVCPNSLSNTMSGYVLESQREKVGLYKNIAK